MLPDEHAVIVLADHPADELWSHPANVFARHDDHAGVRQDTGPFAGSPPAPHVGRRRDRISPWVGVPITDPARPCLNEALLELRLDLTRIPESNATGTVLAGGAWAGSVNDPDAMVVRWPEGVEVATGFDLWRLELPNGRDHLALDRRADAEAELDAESRPRLAQPRARVRAALAGGLFGAAPEVPPRPARSGTGGRFRRTRA